MAASRKLYNEVAASFKDQKEWIEAGPLEEMPKRIALVVLESAASRMGSIFEDDNDSFDKPRFMRACGFPIK